MLIVASGCTNMGLTGQGIAAITGILYVCNTGSASVVAFHKATGITPSSTAVTDIRGASTTIATPYHIAVDTLRDILYIANSATNSILVYDNASTATGDRAPDREITGGLNNPGGIFIDSLHNVLFVGDITGNSVSIYDNASTLDGAIAPTRELILSYSPYGVHVDVSRNILYVALQNHDDIAVWDNALTVNGGVAPNRLIGSGGATLLSTPDGLYVDSSADTLYVANQGNVITIYNGASTANGEIAPSRTIQGPSTTLNSPADLTADTASGILYVSNRGSSSVLVFNNYTLVNGDTAPALTITDPPAAIDSPTGIFFDPTR
jgi:DNA-binding beta-propeller fold protein YncE